MTHTGPHPTAEAPGTGSRRAEQVAVTRLARRMARSGGWRHVLVVTLIALAVAVAVGVAVTARSADLPTEVAVAAEFGAADLRLSQFSGGLEFEDLPGELQEVVRDLGASTSPEAVPVDVESVLHEVVPNAGVLRVESGHAFSPDAGQVWLRAIDVHDPLARGMFRVEGPAPGPGQALVAPALLRDLRGQVGDTVDIPGGGTVEVVGTAQDPRQLQRPVAVLPSGSELGGLSSETVWLVDVPQDREVASPDGGTVADELAAAFERNATAENPADVGVEPRPQYADMIERSDREITQMPTFIGAVVGVALLLQVAFVSAAAFATGTRRRLRDLGLLGAVGASPRHVRGLVMREAAVLGLAGSIIGVVVGAAGAATLGVYVVERVAGNLVPAMQWHAADLLVPAMLGLFAALAAAYLPARTAARVPPTTALAGRLPVRDVPRWVTPVAVGATILGLAVLYEARRSGSDEILMGAGFVAAAVGAAALGVPLLAGLGRLADRLPARVRLAVRDTVRQRTRSAAAVAALTVVLVVPVMLAVSAVTDAARFAAPQDVRRDVVSVSGPHYRGIALPPTQDMVRAAADVLPAVEEQIPLRRLYDASGPKHTSLALEQDHGPDLPDVRYGDVAATASFASAGLATPELLDELGLSHLRDDADAGSAVLLDAGDPNRDGRFTEGPTTIHVDRPDPAGGEPASPDRRDTSVTVPVVVESPDVGVWNLPEVLLPPGVADRLGLVAADSTVLLDLERPIGPALAGDLEQIGSSAPVPFQVSGASTPFASEPAGIIATGVGVALLVALVISGMTAALAATESDHDLELITAVGAPPSIRRRFHGWQAGYHALLAAVLATPTGLAIYRVATVRTTGRPAMIVPWLWLAVIVVAVPALVGLAHAGLMRSARLRAPRRIA